ncbi:hypothetical protein N7541_000320 [Penicillium brevicompactum]|uniref:Uncharacterized protein n=1 Tax=Penicillium brevicompactum TaxID=5074 RepID=A0A9W9RWJ9_PENBR|nr:hypothetical protein N7541_000320 [Penicillium brevicompactum]
MDSAVDHRNPGTKLQALDHEPLIQPAIRDFRQYQGIDQSNVIQGDNLRHAKPQTSNGYNEGPSEDDLPQEAL